MTEQYIEQLVKRSVTFGTKVKKAGLIALTAISVGLILIYPPVGFFLTIVFAILDMFLFKRLDVEYEYVYISGDLHIDRIAGKSTRRRFFSVDVKDVDVIAPTGSPELMGYQHLKAVNYSSWTPGNRTYEMVAPAPKGSGKIRVIFEPSEELLRAMRDMAPRKVIL